LYAVKIAIKLSGSYLYKAKCFLERTYTSPNQAEGLDQKDLNLGTQILATKVKLKVGGSTTQISGTLGNILMAIYEFYQLEKTEEWKVNWGTFEWFSDIVKEGPHLYHARIE
jgi:hypothetical protein